MRVLVINASPRRKGVTSTLLDEFVAASGAHEVESVRIHDLGMRPCVGCLYCRPDKKCVLPRDGAHSLGEAFVRSDVIVIGSPVYWGNVPGPLKTFFDRNVTLFEHVGDEGGWHIPPPQLKGKQALLVVSGVAPAPVHLMASQGGGTVRALKTVLKAGGVRITSVTNIADSANFDTKRDSHLRRMRRLAASLA